MSQGRIDPVILIPSKRASTQELVADVTSANGTSASASRKDQDKKRTTTTSSSRRRRSFKRTRRSTPDSDESDSSIGDNQDETETQNSQDDKHTKEIDQLKAEDKTVEEVTESLAVQEEIEEVDYEAQRKRNILENQRLLQELGLDKSIVRKSFPPIVKTDDYEDNGDVSSDGEYSDKIGSNKPKKGRRFANNKVSWRNAGATVATRASKRIRGEAAIESKVDLEALERSLNGRTGINEDDGEEGSMRRGELATPPPKLGEYSRSLWKGRKQTTGFTMEMEIPSANVPLTVGSIATTIWELGSIYKGEKNKLKYWSGGGSLFKHPYPIGYRAEKFYFRERYMMHIKEGPEGPIFIVESASGRVFEGSSPTLPWTKVCLASSSKGTRISGPLFFGFSDPITQKMIEDLEGYQTFEQVKAEVLAAEEQEEQERLQAEE